MVLKLKIREQRKCCLDVARSHTINKGGRRGSGIFHHAKMKTSSVVVDQVIPCVGEGTKHRVMVLGNKNRSRTGFNSRRGATG
jgi:hypothetical protein